MMTTTTDMPTIVRQTSNDMAMTIKNNNVYVRKSEKEKPDFINFKDIIEEKTERTYGYFINDSGVEGVHIDKKVFDNTYLESWGFTRGGVAYLLILFKSVKENSALNFILIGVKTKDCKSKIATNIIINSGFHTDAFNSESVVGVNNDFCRAIYISLVDTYNKMSCGSHSDEYYKNIKKHRALIYLIAMKASFFTHKYVKQEYLKFHNITEKEYKDILHYSRRRIVWKLRKQKTELEFIRNIRSHRFPQLIQLYSALCPSERKMFLNTIKVLNPAMLEYTISRFCHYSITLKDQNINIDIINKMISEAPKALRTLKYITSLPVTDKQFHMLISKIKKFSNPSQLYVLYVLWTRSELLADPKDENMFFVSEDYQKLAEPLSKILSQINAKMFKYMAKKLYDARMFTKRDTKYPSIKKWVRIFDIIGDGVRASKSQRYIQASKKYNICFHKIDIRKTSLYKSFNKALFNHNQQRVIDRKLILEEPVFNMPIDPEFEKLMPKKLLDERIKTNHDMSIAGQELRHCIGSYASKDSRYIFFRRNTVCVQYLPKEGQVHQCYDIGDTITKESKRYKKEIQKYLVPITNELNKRRNSNKPEEKYNETII